MTFYLQALSLTLAVEAPIVALGYRRVRRWWLGFVAVNLFTHGLLWLAQPRGWPRLISAEIMIALVEAGLYARLYRGGARRALVVSFAANALSLGAGLWLLG
jgi:hypothetical protein